MAYWEEKIKEVRRRKSKRFEKDLKANKLLLDSITELFLFIYLILCGNMIN
jgi:hypothetical protein